MESTADYADHADKKMKIHVQLYAQLRDLAEISKIDLELRRSATVAELIDKIYELKPALRPHDKSILVGAGVDFVGRDYVLNEGDEIAIMPPVQGG